MCGEDYPDRISRWTAGTSRPPWSSWTPYPLLDASAPADRALASRDQRRSNHREAVGLVNVILDHLVVEGHYPHQRGVHS